MNFEIIVIFIIWSITSWVLGYRFGYRVGVRVSLKYMVGSLTKVALTDLSDLLKQGNKEHGNTDN